MSAWSRALGAALAAMSLVPVRHAGADDGRVTAAQALFDEAKQLAAAGRHADACPKLAESQRLDPSMGTEFYLADCLERTGRIATAWTHYVAVADAARIAGQKDREDFARTRADALKPRLPKLVVQVSAEARATPGLSVERDGVALGPAQWGASVPVDPARHTVYATARGKKRWEAIVQATEGGTVMVTVPALELDPASTPGAAPSRAQSPAVAGGKAQRVAGIAIGAAGIVGIGVGAVFGVRTIAKLDERPSGAATASSGAATASSGAATAPSGAATAPSGAATAPSGAATAPSGAATASSGAATAPRRRSRATRRCSVSARPTPS